MVCSHLLKSNFGVQYMLSVKSHTFHYTEGKVSSYHDQTGYLLISQVVILLLGSIHTEENYNHLFDNFHILYG